MKKTILMGIALTTLIVGGAFAEDAKTTTPSKKSTTQMTPEQRQNMATMHEKMAACLRSDKPLSECRTEMQKNCQEMMGAGGCPMAGMGMGMGRMRGGMMGGTAAETPKDVISMDKAQATALKKVPGTVKSSELEREEGKQIYSFDIDGKDGKLHEVWIDAHNGKFLKQKVESAAEEAKESQTEHD